MKIMPVGQILAKIMVSWPAPEGRTALLSPRFLAPVVNAFMMAGVLGVGGVLEKTSCSTLTR